jgi:hypothetical protein
MSGLGVLDSEADRPKVIFLAEKIRALAKQSGGKDAI